MYSVDELDTVVELRNAPQSDVGAPLPVIISDELTVTLAYIVSEPDPDWDGTYVNVVSPDSEDTAIAIIKFHRPYAHMFGPPNDEAFSGHPLAKRGLHPYGVFQVRDSSWIRRLERMNSVHSQHDAKQFEKINHYVFAFHDSTFECVAEGFEVLTRRGSMKSILAESQELLNW
ncbi:MAG: hypothetical protein KA765_05080 [Thermoflexales bacterium]|nr:hypothetical protein [Thermoflexales bacterium]